MAREAKLSPMAMAVLGLLVERSMHPYEMYQLLMHRQDDRLLKVKPGTLYHTVARLADAALIEAAGTEKDGKRPERTSYSILPAGRELLEHRLMELLETPLNEYPAFPQALAEAHNLPPDVVLELLRNRTQELELHIASLEHYAAGAKTRGVEPMFWIHVPFLLHLKQAEREWITTLCADLSSGVMPWPDFETLRNSQQKNSQNF